MQEESGLEYTLYYNKMKNLTQLVSIRTKIPTQDSLTPYILLWTTELYGHPKEDYSQKKY